MNLIHTCPRCKIEHEVESTPEPDQLCPLCDTLVNGNKAELRFVINTKNVPIKNEEKIIIDTIIKKKLKKMGFDIEKYQWFN